MSFWGSGFGVQGLGFGVEGLGFRVDVSGYVGLELTVEGVLEGLELGCMENRGFRVDT